MAKVKIIRKNSTKKSKKTAIFKKKSKWNRLVWHWGNASRASRIVVFAGLFGVIGTATVFFGYAYDVTPRIPKGANQLVLSYEIGMPHVIYEDDFPAGMPPAMLVYGNGLMLCSQNQSAHEHNNDPFSYTQRILDNNELNSFYKQVKSKGFYAIADRKLAGEYIEPISLGKFIRLNSTKGAQVASAYPNDTTTEFIELEIYLQNECDKASATFDPDEIVVETIKIDTGGSQPLPKGIPSDGSLKQAMSKEVKGPEAKLLKSQLSKKAKLYRAQDGSSIRARYLPKLPKYEEPLAMSENSKSKVEAAALAKTRWLYVVASDKSIPSNASSIINEHASSIKYYYKVRTGEDITNAEVKVVKGSKTTAQYRTCPAGKTCASQFHAVFANLQSEFRKDGYNTNILESIAQSANCVGYSNNTGGHYNTDATAAGIGVTTLVGCYWYNGSHIIAAHEAGHGFALPHTCDNTLMDSCGYVKDGSGLEVALNVYQAAFLRDSSPFFEFIAPSKR